MTLEDLRQYQTLRLRAAKMKARVAEMEESLAYGSDRSLSGLPPPTGARDKVGDSAIKLLKVRDKLLDRIAEAEAYALALDEQLAKLTPAQYRIISMRYLDGLPWPAVVRKMPGYSRSTCYRIHNRGLLRLGIRPPKQR